MARKLEQLTKRYDTGQVLFEENESGSRMYVIRKGKVRIYRVVGKDQIVLAELGPGEFLGEMALLESMPRSASAICIEPSELVVVDSKSFADMLKGSPEIAIRIMKNLASRVRELDQRVHNLIADSGAGRAVEVLRHLMSKGQLEKGWTRLPGKLVRAELETELTAGADETKDVLKRLKAANVIRIDGDDVMVSPIEVLIEYNHYLDLKRKYEPAHKAGASRGKKLRIDRLMKALHIDADELSANQNVLERHYRRYLELKQKFEPRG